MSSTVHRSVPQVSFGTLSSEFTYCTVQHSAVHELYGLSLICERQLSHRIHLPLLTGPLSIAICCTPLVFRELSNRRAPYARAGHYSPELDVFRR